VYDIITPNLFIFPKPIGSWNKQKVDPHHRKLIYNFFTIFREYMYPQVNTYEDIVLPRQTKENLVSNDSNEPLLYTITKFKNNNKNFLILHTDNIVDIRDQIKILSHCKNIIVVDGSALLVNGLFVKDKTFHVPTRLVTQSQSHTYPQLAYVLECSRLLNNNNIVYYPSEQVFCQVYDE
jgi:hypothetical protein